jgi:hypothetical protein
MYDRLHQRPVKVFWNEPRCLIRISEAQLGELTVVLEKNGIPFKVDPTRLAINGEPMTACVRFPSDTDRERLQTLLDEVQ